MKHENDYLQINRSAWNAKTEVHYTSEFYNNEEFIKGKSSLNEIEMDLLGNIEGKSILHLQCHFGQDTISLNRLGAKVIGVDLSDKAIEKANELNKETASSAEFVCCDIYDLPNHLNKTFDIVYSSYGTIGWLPDLEKWAQIIHRYLKPGGKFIFVEFHPVIWMYDNNFKHVEYSYFKSEPIIEIETGTYADKDAPISHKSVSWNHSLGEVITAIIKNNLTLNSFNEYDYSPYNCFNKTHEFAPGKYRISEFDQNIPMTYSLVATKSLNT